MARRLYIPALRTGQVALDPAQARHARAVLRLAEGAEVEVFDEAGNVAAGTLVYPADGAAVRIDRIAPPAESVGPRWSVAAAVPKGDRADWMIEKLSELGADSFIPLAAARSVVLPEGKGKRDRWARIAAEAAKQSRRRGVMRIEELTPLPALLVRWDGRANGQTTTRGWFLSTAPDALPTGRAVAAGLADPFVLLIGPEGGWTPAELAGMAGAGLTPVGLTTTILRVETAAVAAAAVVATMGVGRPQLATNFPPDISPPADPESDPTP